MRRLRRPAPALTGRFEKYATKAGLAKGITFHGLRHAFGTWLAAEGMSFSSIQALLVPRDADSTKKQVHVYREDLGLALAKLHLPKN